ncbi:MAG TPA: TerB family tellurite resistance protein [Armatimonadota bacterium]|nr:TerB family tellurite resistance protein [Armatimonadota bacterium]
MFLHILNETQQKSFLSIAKQFIEVDTQLSEEEQNLLELMMAETGLDFDAELPEGNVEDLLAQFDTKQARAAVLLELIGVGHADNEFHAEESHFVQKIGRTFGVSDEQLQAMESWVTRQMALAQEVERFWAD